MENLIEQLTQIQNDFKVGFYTTKEYSSLIYNIENVLKLRGFSNTLTNVKTI